MSTQSKPRPFRMTGVIWMQLAWREYAEGAKPWRSGSKAGRDYFCLTAFVVLAIALGVLTLSIHRGIAVQMADVMLGRFGDDGIGVRFIGSIQRRAGIDRTVIDEFKQRGNVDPAYQGLRMHPIRPINLHYPTIAFAGTNVWEEGHNGTTLPFEGWALVQSDPLWTRLSGEVAGHESLAPRIVLSRAAFQRFDYRKYRDGLKAVLPAPLMRTIPQEQPQNLDTLWLSVRADDSRDNAWDVIPFKAIWVPSFPTEPNVSFLIPLAFASALEAARMEEAVRYFPEASGDVATRYTALTFEVTHPSESEAMAAALAGLPGCLPGTEITRRSDIHVSFNPPKPVAWVESCLQSIGNVRPSRSRTIPSHPLRVESDGRIRVACFSGAPTASPRSSDRPPEADACKPATLDTFKLFEKASVYLGRRSDILDAVSTVLGFRVPGEPDAAVFRVDESYEQALNRFEFFSLLAGIAARPLLLLGIVTLLYLAALQVYGIVERRRGNYGLLMASGMSPVLIHLMVALQMLLCSAAGGIVVWLAGRLATPLLNDWFGASRVQELAAAKLGAEDLRLMADVGTLEMLAMTGTLFVVMAVMASVVLWIIGVRRQGTPISVLS